MGLTRALPAGLLDAGSAALATFASGVYAANYYDRESGELGVFALFFAIFLVAAIVPFKFAFLPGEVRLLSLPKAQQLGGFRLTLPAGVPVALAGSLVVLLALIPAGDAGSSLLIPLAVTTVIAAFLSPIQDHVRRVMHQAGRSWLAATTSIVQLTVALAAIGVAIAADIDRSWVPFGALVVANTVSTTVGLALALRNSRPARGERYRLRSLGVSGRWLTGFGLLPVGATFVAASIVALIAGKDILGSAEAARVAGRPVLVFVAGVAAVMNPPSLIAGRDRNRAEGARLSGIASKVMLVFGAAMFLWMGFDWVGNPMVWLVEEAYSRVPHCGHHSHQHILEHVVLRRVPAHRWRAGSRHLQGLPAGGGRPDCSCLHRPGHRIVCRAAVDAELRHRPLVRLPLVTPPPLRRAAPPAGGNKPGRSEVVGRVTPDRRRAIIFIAGSQLPAMTLWFSASPYPSATDVAVTYIVTVVPPSRLKATE